MKGLSSGLCVAILLSIAFTSPVAAEEFSFPDTPDGRRVLAADYHIHTVFSDGSVWPTVRVAEAVSEGLSVIALTEHIELTVHKEFLAESGELVDKNQPHVIAEDYAANLSDNAGEEELRIIRGAEVTRGFGHFNCIYTMDNNRFRVPGRDDDPSILEDVDAQSYRDTINSLTEAKEQGAFCFWNHPYAPGQEAGSMDPRSIHKELISKNLISGIEVANGGGIFYDAIDTAMEHNLAMFGNSDLHGPAVWKNGNQRTVTLVLAQSADEEAIRTAMEERQTVALYRNTLIGRSEPVTQIVQGALTASLMPTAPGWHVSLYPVKIQNDSSMPFTLEIDPSLTPFYETDILTIAGNSVETVVMYRNPEEAEGLKARVLNSHVDGRERAKVILPFRALSEGMHR